MQKFPSSPLQKSPQPYLKKGGDGVQKSPLAPLCKRGDGGDFVEKGGNGGILIAKGGDCRELGSALSSNGNPPALPGDPPKFDSSGSVLFLRNLMMRQCRTARMDCRCTNCSALRARSGPFEGPARVKPPALPGDTY